MSSNIPTPPVVPPMSGGVREFLYGVFAWTSIVLSAALLACATLTGFNVTPPEWLFATLGTAQAVVGSVWGWLGFVAKANVATGA